VDQRQQACDAEQVFVTAADVHKGEPAAQPTDFLVKRDELTDPATVHPGNSAQIEK